MISRNVSALHSIAVILCWDTVLMYLDLTPVHVMMDTYWIQRQINVLTRMSVLKVMEDVT